MKKIKNILQNILMNIYVAICNLFIHRDKNIIVIGAWMGLKFADNSRFLYQHLFLNKEKLNLKRVVWVTRNEELNKKLRNLGYDSVLIGTKESKYIHLKAGVHIINNIAFEQKKFHTDIDTRYSFGAIKINLWHGIPMKSVGSASNQTKKILKNRKKNFITKIFSNNLFRTISSLGGWSNQYFLSTSEINMQQNEKITNCRKDRFFISSYPRNCKCLKLLDNEKKILKVIKKYKGTILYLPTFRDNYKNYKHPLTDDKIINYIENNNILWLEKPHTASDFDYSDLKNSKNIIFLDSDFDINVLISNVSIIMTDYSSVLFDAVYFNIPTILYTPDLYEFKNGNVGFLIDIEEYFDKLLVKDLKNVTDIFDIIINKDYFSKEVIELYERINTDFYENKKADYYYIWNDILKIIYKKLYRRWNEGK